MTRKQEHPILCALLLKNGNISQNVTRLLAELKTVREDTLLKAGEVTKKWLDELQEELSKSSDTNKRTLCQYLDKLVSFFIWDELKTRFGWISFSDFLEMNDHDRVTWLRNVHTSLKARQYVAKILNQTIISTAEQKQDVTKLLNEVSASLAQLEQLKTLMEDEQ